MVRASQRDAAGPEVDQAQNWATVEPVQRKRGQAGESGDQANRQRNIEIAVEDDPRAAGQGDRNQRCLPDTQPHSLRLCRL